MIPEMFGRTLFVNNSTGLDTNDGSKAAPFLTARAAITAADPGDTIALISTGTDYDLAGALEKAVTLLGSGSVVNVKGATTSTNSLLVSGATVIARRIRPTGATATGASGVRVQDGGRLLLDNCIVHTNDRAVTLADTAHIEAIDTSFTSNPAGFVVGTSCTGEFIRTSGMTSNTVDTRGVRNTSGSIHHHTHLRVGLFYAADEFYQPGDRHVWVSPTGNDAAEGTESAPVQTLACAIRLLGARRVSIAAGTYTTRDIPVSWDVDLIGRRDGAGGVVILDATGGTFGLMPAGCNLGLYGSIRVTGASSHGIYSRQANITVQGYLELDNNGGNGYDGIQGSTMTGTGFLASHDNGVDGIGAHQRSYIELTRPHLYNNGDDGASPHDDSQIILHDPNIHDNTDRGFVAVLGGRAVSHGGQIINNGGQNFSVEDAGSTGKLVGTILDAPVGVGAVNARASNGAAVELLSVRDAAGALVTPTVSGGATAKVDLNDRENVRREVLNGTA